MGDITFTMYYRLMVYIKVDEHQRASGVMVNDDGAWLGELEKYLKEDDTDEPDYVYLVNPFRRVDGSFYPAPEGWQILAEPI